jgi:hypothetical protein
VITKRFLLLLTACASLVGCIPDPDPQSYTDPQRAFVALHKDTLDRDGVGVNSDILWEQREKRLCERLPLGNISDWVGIVSEVGKKTDAQQSAFINVKIYTPSKKIFFVIDSAAIYLQTHNHEPSKWASANAAPVYRESNHETTIARGTPLYEQLMFLSAGDKVRFSGNLFKDTLEGACFFDISMFISSKIRSPQYIMKLTKIEKLQ